MYHDIVTNEYFVSITTALIVFALGLVTNRLKHRHDVSRFKSETFVKLFIERAEEGMQVAEELMNLMNEMSRIQKGDTGKYLFYEDRYRDLVTRLNRCIHSFPIGGRVGLRDKYDRFRDECSCYHTDLLYHIQGIRVPEGIDTHRFNAGKLLNEIRDKTMEGIEDLLGQ